MRIHREGYRVISWTLTSFLLLNIIVICLFYPLIIMWITVLAVSCVMIVFLLFFFRRPVRKINESPGNILSSADGTVVVIEEVEENEYFKDRRLQVSVFMSLFNAHINSYPVSGKVKYVKYHPGKFYLARQPKSSVYNERTSVVVETDDGTEILIRQIAGTVARRIVTYAEPGVSVAQGSELGFIKFGSRVDIFLPAGAKPEAEIGQKVRANKDILARL